MTLLGISTTLNSSLRRPPSCRSWVVVVGFLGLFLLDLKDARSQDTNTSALQAPAAPQPGASGLQLTNTPVLQSYPASKRGANESYGLIETNQSPFLPAPYAPGTFPPPQLGPQPATGTPGVPPGDRFGGTSQLASGASVPTGVPSTAPNPLQWGPITFAPHLVYQLSYGNGLQASPGQQVNSFVNQLSPGMLLQLGRHWSLDYTPTLRFYSDRRFQDGTDHAVSLFGGTTYEAWSFGLSQSYASSSQPLIETAAQTGQETYSTSLSASHPLGSRLSLDLSLSQNFLFLDNTSFSTQGFSDRRSWATMDWLDYQLWPKFTAGVGVGFTYDNMAVGPDMTTELYQGRIVWLVENKLHLVLSGGLSDMQFLSSGASDLLSPVFSLSAQYQLFDFTTLYIGASRAVSPSYYQSQVTESTGLNAGLSQRLLRHLYLNVGGGYSTSTYRASAIGPAVAGASNYDTASYSVSLSTTFLARASASIFFSQNYLTSGSAAYNYTTTQTGLTLGYRF